MHRNRMTDQTADSDDREILKGALSGIRIVDLSRVLAGPWCTQCFADMGAEVLKVEPPGVGDETRTWSPPSMGGHAAYFTCVNRGKSSIVLDLKAASDRDRLLQAIAVADVVVENFRAGSLDRLGLGVDVMMAANPRLIICSISGYGRSGPEASRAGYDFVIQAESGLMAVTGDPDSQPMKVGVAVSDLFAGLYASQAILAALIARDRTGKGTHLDVSMFDCQVAAMANVAANALATDMPSQRHGNGHPNVVPYRVFEAKDQPFVVAVGNDSQFGRLARDVIGQPQLPDDPRFATNEARSCNRELLNATLADLFRQRTAETWLTALRKVNIPGGRINDVTDALATKQAEERQLVQSFSTEGGQVCAVRYPVRAEGLCTEVTPPPKLGEGGEALLRNWLAG